MTEAAAGVDDVGGHGTEASNKNAASGAAFS